eukprot:gnl/TRDRNA2_/TRDRNA2_32789_c0_seq1.p1 gnl/TRDRNA2_/TRDRNA2_32789_c0~~gnl/TRDRNA2_/TRDRNA2_32789_c0_seq1.p1  ORF type:complete len:821 (+),score=141.90 gnl/TRDRNA2_/TRDRNA2_32789_c0_seq1:223-2463(+)
MAGTSSVRAQSHSMQGGSAGPRIGYRPRLRSGLGRERSGSSVFSNSGRSSISPSATKLDKNAVYPDGAYDPEAARQYFSRRPLDVVGRATSLALLSAGFGLKLLADYAGGKLETRANERASDLAKLLVKLGPTFIKLGQSASVRSDLLPAAYIEGLTQLQDEVPPFSSEKARAIINEELGDSSPFATLSDEPIAAASLGQVYKGALANGTEVAVKVQRPNMERQIALDMLLIRDFAAPLAKAFKVPGDLVGTADAWGSGLVDELNYNKEAANAAKFNSDLANSPMSGRAFAPCVVDEASSRRVLTTVWVAGERLDRCSVPEDVPRMCSVAMNTYLEMMLDTGVLHCDPHPGNLLRTPDGKLCILDWGLVTCIRSDLQLTLIEHVAHLTAKDYAKVPNDLVRLEFVPPGAEETVVESGVVDFLTGVYSAWGSGGGAAKLDVPKLFDEVRALAAGTDDGLFQVPPYFAYIAKSFSVLEGIGLSVDGNYSVVDETLPYIARRILTDPSPRTAGALETYLFGDGKHDTQSRVLDADRVEQLVFGAGRYAATSTANETSVAAENSRDAFLGGLESGKLTATVSTLDVDSASDAIFDLLLSKEPLPLQDIVLEQLALIMGAAGREAWSDLRERSGTSFVSGRSRISTLVDPLGLFKGLAAIVETDDRDREVLAAANKLASIASDLRPALGVDSTAEFSTEDVRNLADILVRKLWTRRDELEAVLNRLGRKLVAQNLQRVLEKSRFGSDGLSP